MRGGRNRKLPCRGRRAGNRQEALVMGLGILSWRMALKTLKDLKVFKDFRLFGTVRARGMGASGRGVRGVVCDGGSG